MDPVLESFLFVVALTIANGLFAGAEIAVLSVRKTRLRELVRRRDKRALAVEALRETPERFLATVQIGITVVGAVAGAVGGPELAAGLTPYLTRLGLGNYAATVALVVVVIILSVLSLVLGELVPKSLALRYSDRYSFLVARPLWTLAQVARPLVWVLTAMSNVFLQLFGDRTTFTETRLSRDELQQLVEEAAKTGSVDARSSEIASRALGFGEVTVAEVMVPRVRVAALRSSASADEVRTVLIDEGYSRFPVYDHSPDQMIGYVVAREALAMAATSAIQLAALIRPHLLVAESRLAADLLRDMQKSRRHLAVVEDEHGVFAGIVTLEDLVEELVGDIFSEDETPETYATRQPDGTVLVQGWAAVRKVNRDFGTDLPVGKDRTTIAGLCMALAHAIPQAGERITTEDGTVIEIVEASARRVRQVRLHLRPADPTA